MGILLRNGGLSMRLLFTKILVLISLVSFPSWGETWNELVKREGLWYKKFTDVPFTGEVDEGHEQGTFKKGKRDGYWVVYDPNGQLISKGHYKNGEREGHWVRYYPNGRLGSKGVFKNGKKECYQETYFPDGTKWPEYTGTYKNGLKVSD